MWTHSGQLVAVFVFLWFSQPAVTGTDPGQGSLGVAWGVGWGTPAAPRTSQPHWESGGEKEVTFFSSQAGRQWNRKASPSV